MAVRPTGRLVSLDVFRGITMAAMVVVNNPGDWGHVYPPLLHAPWHGCTPTDLIFPFFLFIVGVSITLSKRSASARSILTRAGIILGVGLFLSGYPRFDLETWRIPGVLQRIAVCYAVAALLYARTRRASAIAAVAAALLLVYWAVTMLVPVPDGTAGDLSPAGNVGAFLDRTLMPGHLWKPDWDPEGLLSTVPAIATTLLGLLAGLWMGSAAPASRKTGLLALAGVAGLGLGLAWGVFFPINKSLWTSSYAVFTGGAAALFLALCYWAIDIRGSRWWTTPFVMLGANALALYALAWLLSATLANITLTADDGQAVSLLHLIYTTAFEPLASPRNASLLYALANLAVLFVILFWMYRRRIFLRA